MYFYSPVKGRYFAKCKIFYRFHKFDLTMMNNNTHCPHFKYGNGKYGVKIICYHFTLCAIWVKNLTIFTTVT